MNKVKLGEILKIKHGYAFKSDNYVNESKYALVTLANISSTNNFQFNRDKTTFYGASFPKEFILSEDDLIMPLTEQVVGLFGNTAFVPEMQDVTFILNQRVGKVVPVDGKADKYYLHYLLATNLVKNQLEYRASGTKQRNISPDDVYDVEVFLPDIITQRKIGKCLYNIEKKVNLNNRINDSLQQIAKTIYDYWFTQFDFPDDNGKPYCSSGGQMEWNEELKRNIPNGWEVKRLGDLLTKNTDVFDYQSVQPAIDLSVMPSDSISLSQINTSENFATNLFSMKTGDILFGSIRPYLHKAGIAPCDGVVAGTVHSYRVKESEDYNFALITMCQSHFFDYAVNVSSGTKMPVVSSDALLDYKVAYSRKVAKTFNQIALQQTITKTVMENQCLIALRDWLLPVLMNGQVTVLH